MYKERHPVWGALFLFHNQFAVLCIHGHSLAGEDFAPKKLFRQHRLHRMLDIPAQRPGSVLRIIAGIHDGALGSLGQFHADLLILQALVQLCDLQVDDLRHIFLGQRLI